MDHSSQLDTPNAKGVERPIRRVRSPSRPRAWVSRSYKPKAAGKFQKFGREDQAAHKPGFHNNQGPGHFKARFYFHRKERFKRQAAAAERKTNEGFKERISGQNNAPSQQAGHRLFPPRSTSSRDQDRRHSGSKSDKSQSRERDHRSSRSKEPEPDQSTAKQAAARDRAIQKKRREIDQVYYQECEMFGLVVKMLIAKDPSLEIPIQASLQQNLRDIGARCVKAMEKFIEDYDSRELTL